MSPGEGVMKKSRHKALRQKATLPALVSVLTCGSTGMVYAADQADSSEQKEKLIIPMPF